MTIENTQNTYGVGRRKTASARAFVKPGNGKLVINGRTLDNYFTRPTSRMVVQQPLEVLNLTGQFDIQVKVIGGGPSGQAGAVQYAIARALAKYDETVLGTDRLAPNSFRRRLRSQGLFTRDARKVERKKYGLRKARRSVQFSKR